MYFLQSYPIKIRISGEKCSFWGKKINFFKLFDIHCLIHANSVLCVVNQAAKTSKYSVCLSVIGLSRGVHSLVDFLLFDDKLVEVYEENIVYHNFRKLTDINPQPSIFNQTAPDQQSGSDVYENGE